MNRKIIIILAILITICLAGLYVLKHGQTLLVKPPSEERVAYISNIGNQTDIWTMKLDGSDRRNVTDDMADDRLPAWSPDSLEIVSASNRNGTYQLALSAWDGRYSRLITTSTGTKDVPTFASNGEEILYLSSSMVYSMDKDSGSENQRIPTRGVSVVPGLTDRGYPVDVKLSANREFLLLILQSDIGRQAVVLETKNGSLDGIDKSKPLTIAITEFLDARWSPSKLKLAFAFQSRNGQSGLDVFDLEGMSKKQLISSKDTAPAKLAWSPDGGSIAYEFWVVDDGARGKVKGIYAVDSNGGIPVKLFEGKAFSPTWSSDGKYVIFVVQREDEGRDIWRVNADGSDPQNLTGGVGDNYSPTCSPIVNAIPQS